MFCLTNSDYDWSSSLKGDSIQTQRSSSESLLICHNPLWASAVNRTRTLASVSAPCRCVHCFLRDVYCLIGISRCACSFVPTQTTDSLLLFSLESAEVERVQMGSLRIALFSVAREESEWQLSSVRYRLLLNSADLFSLQVVIGVASQRRT